MDTRKQEEGGDVKKQQHQKEQKQSEVVKGGPIGKSCKGYLYYTSSLKSSNRNPRCIGIPRTLKQVPNYAVGKSEVEASKDGHTLLDFYYACAGYSVYKTLQDPSTTQQQKKTELPVCLGLELLIDRKFSTADTASAPAPAPAPCPVHGRNKEDVRGSPQPRVLNKPAQSSGDDFLSRFTRNANVVASGVYRNMRRVGNYVKESLDDILYPYRRRPK